MLQVSDNDLIRFSEKVIFPDNDPGNTDQCWLWNGAKHSRSRGYGKFRFHGKVMNSHKASYLMFNGDLAANSVVSHKCNNENCVNPFHLEEASQSENMKYCVSSGRHNSQKRKKESADRKS